MAIEANTTSVACHCLWVRFLRDMGSSGIACPTGLASEVPHVKCMKSLMIAAEMAAAGL
jgi:hypothetical protein